MHTSTPQHHHARHARGNTIVLVIGILVLLVIIATAFVVRTQAGRITSDSVKDVGLREDNERTIAKDLAGVAVSPLFAWPVDVTTLGTPLDLRVGSNAARFPAGPNALRFFGDDRDLDGNNRPDYPANTPSFAVVPFTNWPDPGTLADNGGSPVVGIWPGGNGAVADWPAGNGNPNAIIGIGSPLRSEWNPLGNPGEGDFRALRDNEPARWDTNNDEIPDAYSHWRHMTNIARADNGYRIVFDISDIGDAFPAPAGDGFGRLVTDLNVPVEQFLTIRHNYLNAATGDTDLSSLGLNNFMNNWGNWLGVSPAGIGGYINAYRDPALIPPNLLRLRDLDADGILLEDGERPQDEFAGPGINPTYPAGTPRWYAGRVLADTDGDGYTDSFWFLAPTSVQAGVRTIVAVSMIDNQGMVNVNVATRFIRSDLTGVPQKTRGLTATDLAMVGQLRPEGSGNFNVGLFDTWDNWFSAAPVLGASRYPMDQNSYWTRHLQQVGLTNAAGVALVNPSTVTRLEYWRRAASKPLSADSDSFYTPYGLSDELELRMYSGQNYPWILSRLEFAAGGDQNDAILRSGLGFEESSEFIDQLNNRQLVRDIRHRMTTYNGARNDFAPPWLWLYGPNKDHDGNGFVNNLDLDLNRDTFINVLDQNLYNAGARKFDLRLPYDQPGYAVFVPGDWDGVPGFDFTTNDRIVNTALPPKFWPIGIALRDRIAAGLIDAFDNLPGNRGSYYGNSPADVDRTLELAAAYAANIAHFRDRETPLVANDVSSHEFSRLNEAVPVAPGPTVTAPTARFMGMEPQPFIVEAFIGHIYGSQVIPAFDNSPTPVAYSNAGNNVVIEGDPTRRSTVVAVQIANPYNRPINLDDPDVQFQVRVFGQEFDLAGLGTLLPATEDVPNTIILYAIQDQIVTGSQLIDRWQDFLDIDGVPAAWINLPPNTQVVRVDTSRWDVESRNTYDTSNDPAVDIRRRDPVTAQWVTIDRVDAPADRRFGDAVNAMAASAPPLIDPPNLFILPDPAGGPYPGYDLGPATLLYDHWVQWVRATRAWGVDVDNDGEYDYNEMNPRYVFGDCAIASAAGDPVTDLAVDGPTFVYGGNRYKFTAEPDSPWFTRPYTREQPLPAVAGQNEIVITRKPTFFDFNHGEIAGPAPAPGTADPAWPNWSFPNKGWYGQKGPGSPDDVVIAAIAPAPPPGQPTGERTYRTPFAFQMLQKDDDFEQVGELLNVFLYGHKLEFTNNTPSGTFTGVTTTTFSEYLSQPQDSLTGYQDRQQRVRVNRLLLTPVAAGGAMGQIVGLGDPTVIDDPRHAVPDLPAGVRLLEAFVCDGFGCAPLFDLNGDGSTFDEAEGRTLYNAKGFDGSATPGSINVNTASTEATRCLPNMMRTVHETGLSPDGSLQYYSNQGLPLVTTALNPQAVLPRTMVPESIVQSRENANGDSGAAFPTGIIGGPNYELGVKPRGFSTIGEVAALNQSARYNTGYVDRLTSNITDRIYNEQWRIDLDVAGVPLAVGAILPPKPFLDLPGAGADQTSMVLSVDRQDVWDPAQFTIGATRPDYIAGDAEEANMLFAGISNLITTRSDVFTVYFKVRTFRQNTSVSPPRWDATNPEYIVDDSRYVMLVDRSGVNHPGDQPRILYMEKLPN